MNEKELYIPVNVVDSDDFLSGFGKKEIGITFTSSVIAIIFILLMYSITQNILMAIIPGVIFVSITIVLIKRDRFDESFIDKMRYFIQFTQAQKKYEYVYFNVLEESKTKKKGK